MKAFEPFDQIRIISLPERTDRRRGMDKELAKVGLLHDQRVSYFEAIRPDNVGNFSSVGARGVYESQLSVLKQAAAAHQSVLILEDDCAFIDGASEREIEDGWDIFYGGYTAHDPDHLNLSNIEGAHMMGFSAAGAEMISVYLEALTVDDIHPPIDAAYVWFRRAYPDVPTCFARPSLAGQRASRSDIANLKWFDRIWGVRNLANSLRVLRTHQ